MDIINLTPHAIVIMDEVGRIKKNLESQGVVRLTSNERSKSELDGIPLIQLEYGNPEGLPEEKKGVYYIVSSMVSNACADRHDLLVPSKFVRDEVGRIIGCTAFQCRN